MPREMAVKLVFVPSIILYVMIRTTGSINRAGVSSREQKAKDKEAKAAAEKERIAAAAAAAKWELQAKLGKGPAAAQQQQQRGQQQREQRTLEEFESARTGKDAVKVRTWPAADSVTPLPQSEQSP